jgi:hypothetical protein
MNEDEARARMAEAEAVIMRGIEQGAAPWVERMVTRFDPGLEDQARAAGERGAARVASELDALFATDVAQQRSTPLEIVRSLRIEATAVLRDAGVEAVTRDPFEVRAFPDDVYGIVPRDLAEFGDEELRVALLAWGMAKAHILRARSDTGLGGKGTQK